MNTQTTSQNTETHESLGITLATRQTTSHSMKPGYTGRHPQSDETIDEPGWSLDNMLERFSFKATYPWSTTNPSHTILSKLRVPQDLIVNTITNAPFTSFMFWRGDVELHLQVTGTPFHQGMLAAVFVPLTDDAYTVANIISNFSSMSVNQTCYLFPNTNTSAVMNIPFNSVQHYLDLSDTSAVSVNNTLGYVYLVVFNQLALASTATDTCTVSVFSKFKNNKFKVPRQSVPIVLSAIPQAGVMRFAKKLIPKHVVKDVIDSGVNAASSFAKSTITGLISNLDKPTDANMTRVVNSGLGRLNFTEGVENIDKLGYAADDLPLTTEETFATDTDEMTMGYLKSKYSYLGTFNVTTAGNVGDVVASFPMNPNPNNISLQKENIVPLISYVSSPYQYWTGSLNYKFVVVATSLQTCKLFVSMSYGTFTVPTTISPSAITSQYGEAFEINQGSNQIEMTVPYNSTTPLKHMPNGWAPSSTDTLGMMNIVILNKLVAPNNTPTTISINVFVSGGPDFNVSTLGVSNQYTPVEIPPAVFATQTENSDDEFEVVSVQKRKSQRIMIAKAQASTDIIAPFVTTETVVDTATEQLVSPANAISVRKSHTQPFVESIKSMLKKYQLLSQVPIAIPAGGTGTNIVGGIYTRVLIQSLLSHPVAPILLAGTPPASSGLVSLYSSLFRQFYGSLRFKIMPDTWSGDTFNNFAVYYEPPINRPTGATVDVTDANDMYANNSFAYSGKANQYNKSTTSCNMVQAIKLPVHFTNGIEKTAEFEVPFTSRFSSLLLPNNANAVNRETSDFGTLVIYACNSSVNTTAFNLYMSLGDETRFGNLYQVPWITPLAQKSLANVLIGPSYPDQYTTSPPTTSFNTLSIL